MSDSDLNEVGEIGHGLGILLRLFPTGWKLWARSLRTLTLHTAPLALLMGVIGSLDNWAAAEGAEDSISTGAAVGLGLVAAFGMALTSVILSQRHTGFTQENPYGLTLRRIIPWGVTWVLIVAVMAPVLPLVGWGMLVSWLLYGGVPIAWGPVFALWFIELANLLGFFGAALLMMVVSLLSAAGPIVALRLYWADEFALAHRAGPIRALKESWRLTKKATFAISIFQFLLGTATMVIALAAVVVGMAIALLMGIAARIAIAALIAITGVAWAPPAIGVFTGAAMSLFFFLFFLVYGSFHAPQLVYFYGMRAARARLARDEAANSGRDEFAVSKTFLVVLGVGLFALGLSLVLL